MAHFLVKVVNYEYGVREKEWRIEAGNGGTAAARAFRMYRKEKVAGKKRLRNWRIEITRV